MSSRPSPGKSYFRIAVAGDLHAFADSGSAPIPSHFRISDPEEEPGKHPLAGLRHLIDENNIRADLLLCPGDIGHQADQLAIQHAWASLRKLKDDLHAEHLIATAGNHDLDSRFKGNQYSPREFLQSLSPPFPFPSHSESLNDKFWSRDFAVLDGGIYRVVVINSSAYHGVGEGEVNHGRVAESTLRRIRESLESLEPKPIGILLCHHHPQQHMELKLGDYDVMKNGQLLLDTLGTGRIGRWLAIHGHKHHPKITYASGGGTSLTVLSSGSLCASLYPELQSVARNQFHLISIPQNELSVFGFVGIVESWDWASGEGWAPAGSSSGLPAVCGFGFRCDPIILADRVAEQVVNESELWDQIRSALPQLDFLLPQDFEALKYALSLNYHLRIQELAGLPRQIGRYV